MIARSTALIAVADSPSTLHGWRDSAFRSRRAFGTANLAFAVETGHSGNSRVPAVACLSIKQVPTRSPVRCERCSLTMRLTNAYRRTRAREIFAVGPITLTDYRND